MQRCSVFGKSFVKQECIPVGCVPSAAVAISPGGCGSASVHAGIPALLDQAPSWTRYPPGPGTPGSRPPWRPVARHAGIPPAMHAGIAHPPRPGTPLRSGTPLGADPPPRPVARHAGIPPEMHGGIAHPPRPAARHAGMPPARHAGSDSY